VLLGFGFSYCHSILQTYATDLLPQGRATAVSVFAFSLFLGSGLGPVAGGSVYDLFGVGAMLGAATGGMLLFCLMCSSFLRKQAVLGNK
jgi:predicted MFS family arabinose efflux permease